MIKAYVALIGGPAGVFSRISGSIPRQIAPEEKAKFQATLDAGGSIEVICESREAWDAMRCDLFAQLGIVA